MNGFASSRVAGSSPSGRPVTRLGQLQHPFQNGFMTCGVGRGMISTSIPPADALPAAITPRRFELCPYSSCRDVTPRRLAEASITAEPKRRRHSALPAHSTGSRPHQDAFLHQSSGRDAAAHVLTAAGRIDFHSAAVGLYAAAAGVVDGAAHRHQRSAQKDAAARARASVAATPAGAGALCGVVSNGIEGVRSAGITKSALPGSGQTGTFYQFESVNRLKPAARRCVIADAGAKQTWRNARLPDSLLFGSLLAS